MHKTASQCVKLLRVVTDKQSIQTSVDTLRTSHINSVWVVFITTSINMIILLFLTQSIPISFLVPETMSVLFSCVGKLPKITVKMPI